MPGPVHVIVNPTSGGGRGRRARARVEAELARAGKRFTVEETPGPGTAFELARRAAESDVATIISVGGDGTAHEVANGILRARTERRPALGVVPVGTGNDFAKLLGVPPDRPLALLGSAQHARFDVGLASWEGGSEYFINGMGTGIDVEVVRQIERLPRMPGVVGYLIGVLRALASFDPSPLSVTADHHTLHRRFMIIAVMNGHCQGGGFHVCPAAAPDDGRLDLCLIDELDLARSLRVLPLVMRGRHTDRAEVTMLRAARLEIELETDSPLFFQLDGELRAPKAGRRLTVELQPQALEVLRVPTAPGAEGESAAGAAARTPGDVG